MFSSPVSLLLVFFTQVVGRYIDVCDKSWTFDFSAALVELLISVQVYYMFLCTRTPYHPGYYPLSIWSVRPIDDRRLLTAESRVTPSRLIELLNYCQKSITT
jgi:hypothetical protein